MQVNVTSTPVQVTIPGGTPVTVSAAVTLGFTEEGAASGPTLSGTFNWPNNVYTNTYWVVASDTATLNYMS
jgi:hypothetical protein